MSRHPERIDVLSELRSRLRKSKGLTILLPRYLVELILSRLEEEKRETEDA